MAAILAISILGAVTACLPTPIAPTPSSTVSPTAAASVTLWCEDGVADPTPIPQEILLTEQVGGALLDERASLPKAVDVGIPEPSEEQWKFRKAPLFLQGGSGTVPLGVPEDGHQYLLWTSADAWTGDDASIEERQGWTSSRVVAHACEEQTTSF